MPFLKGRRKPIIVGIIFFVALSVLSLCLINPSGQTGFCKKIALQVISPFQHAVNYVFTAVDDAWERYVFLIGLAEKNRELEEKYLVETRERITYRESYFECLRLKKLLGLKQGVSYPTVAARVVGRERSSLFKTVIIDKGASDGVAVDLPVIAAAGVVGKVIDVSWTVSKVLLLVDYNSSIDCIIQRTRTQGILQGTGDDDCALKYVQCSEKIAAGDVVVTSGLAGVYPKGLFIGTVSGVERRETQLFLSVRVSPAVDMGRLEELLIVMVKEMTP